MHVMSNLSVFVINIAAVPHTSTNIFIRKFIKDTIASQNNEIVIFGDFEGFYLWDASYNIRIASSKFYFSLWISKGP
jgi:hypothetical protein